MPDPLGLIGDQNALQGVKGLPSTGGPNRPGDPAFGNLLKNAAEAIEAVAHGNSATSQVVGRAIGDISLPPGTTIGALVRDGIVYIAHSNLKVMTDDHVILFLVDKSQVHEVENLFQVKRGFL